MLNRKVLCAAVGVSALIGVAGVARADDVYIPLISKGFQHQFWQAVKAGAEQSAAENKVKITFEGPETEAMVDKQIDMLSADLAKHPQLAGINSFYRPTVPQLKVEVDRENPIAFEREKLRQIKRRRCLGRPALEIGDCHDLQLVARPTRRQKGQRLLGSRTRQISPKLADLRWLIGAPTTGREGRGGAKPVERQLPKVPIRHAKEPRDLTGRKRAQGLLRRGREQRRAQRLHLPRQHTGVPSDARERILSGRRRRGVQRSNHPRRFLGVRRYIPVCD